MLAVMLVLPAAAQADDLENSYSDITISDLFVNYAGTEFDFTGLDLTLLAGADVENRNAIGGVMAQLAESESGAGLVVQLNADDAVVLLGNQLIKLPYDSMGETLAGLGMADAEQLGDFAQQIDLLWAQLAQMDDDMFAGFEQQLEQLFAGDSANALNQQINALLAEAVPEEAAFTVDGVEYQGQKLSITISAEQMNSVLASEQMQAYYDGMGSAMASLYAQLGLTTVEVNGEDMPVDEFVNTLMGAASQIKYADDMSVDVYVAPYGEDEQVILMDYGELTIDMSAYMAAVSELDSSAELDEDFVLSFDQTIAMIGEMDENFNIDDVEYMEQSAEIANPMDESAPITMTLKLTDRDDAGSFLIDMNVPAEPEAVTMTVSADWSDSDGKELIDASFDVFDGQEEVGFAFNGDATDGEGSCEGEYTLTINGGSAGDAVVSLAYNYAESGDDAGEGNVTLSMDDGTTGLIPVASLDYSVSEQESGDTDTADVVFSVDLMGMVTASGKLSVREMPMSAETLLPTEGALDLSTATDEDIQAMAVSLQTGVQSLLVEAMNIPGVQQIMALTQATGSSATVETTITNEAAAG